jgi:hypothetical protein
VLSEAREPNVSNDLGYTLSRLVQFLDTEAATRSAQVMASHITGDTQLNIYYAFYNDEITTDPLNCLLSSATPSHIRQRSVAVVAVAAAASGGLTAALPALPVAAEPIPCRLPTQDLVEMLKYPTCVGPARRVILNHLGNRYGRRFDTHWQFVRYAQDAGLNLDFTTPPKRPPKTLPPLFGP